LLYCGKFTSPLAFFLNYPARFLAKKTPPAEAPIRNVFQSSEVFENDWYKNNWSNFYTSTKTVKKYDSNISLLKFVKGGEKTFNDSALSMLDLSAESCVVDLCCGTGSFTTALAGAVGESGKIYGIDLSPEMISQAESNDETNKINFKIMDALKTEFPDGYFDVVTIVAVLHEIPENQRAILLAEAKRILKPNGKLLIGEHFVAANPFYRLIQKSIFRIISKKAERATFAEMVKNSLSTEVDRAGFRIITTRTLPFHLFQLLLAEHD
jgi:ubiquinone/menaquinone biosynthesis C-methylase UbiE